MNKKKLLTAGLAVIAVCFSIVLIYGLLNQTTMRSPTAEETAKYAPYAIDWQAATGLEGADVEIILSLCTFQEELTIGENRYKRYTSDTLGDYLCHYQEELSVSLYLEPETGAEKALYVQYNDAEGETVILGYDQENGLMEMGIFNPHTDVFYHWLQGNVEVWEKFAGGVRWGMT